MEMEVIELVPPAPLVLELKTKKGESPVHIYIYTCTHLSQLII